MMEVMENGAAPPGKWISYGSGPGGKDHLPAAVRAQVEEEEALRTERRGRLLCEVTVFVYEREVTPHVSFTEDAALGVESDASDIAAAVARARDSLADWR